MGLSTVFSHVNRALVPIKLHYGLYNGGTATVSPAMPVYAKVLHFSSFSVGIIYAVIRLMTLIMKPAFCTVADKFKWHRSVLMSWLFILMAAYFSIQFIPPDDSNQDPNRDKISSFSLCSAVNGSSYFLAEYNGCDWTCSAGPERCAAWNLTRECANIRARDTLPMIHDYCIELKRTPTKLFGDDCVSLCPYSSESTDTYEQDSATTFAQWQFWIFLILLVAADVGNAIVMTIADTVCVEICGDSKIYGKQRLWGSIMWGIFSIITGFVVDAFSEKGEQKNYTPVFYIMLVPLGIDAVVFYFIKFEIPHRSKNIASEAWSVLLNPRSIVILLWCMMVGVSFGLLGGFLYWHLENLASSLPDKSVTDNIKTIEGLVMGVQTILGETPAYFFGGLIVAKIGHGRTFSLILGIIGLRFSLYSILVNPWWTLPLEVLHCYHGLFYSAMISYAKTIAPPGTEATIQSVLAAVCEGIGMAIGSLLGGVIFDAYGGALLFRGFGISFFVMLVLNEAFELYQRMRERKSEQKDTEDTYILR